MTGDSLKIALLEAELEQYKDMARDWVKANAPGGWIRRYRLRAEAAEVVMEALERRWRGYAGLNRGLSSERVFAICADELAGILSEEGEP